MGGGGGVLAAGIVVGRSLAGHAVTASSPVTPAKTPPARYAVTRSDADWRGRLTSAQYDVLRQSGTEYPFSSKLDGEWRPGTYSCVGCGHPLYDAATKFDSGTGWPSFFRPLPEAIATSSDDSFGGERTEVHCATCGGHLGHVFADGPKPTGLRYCMNGVALSFTPKTA